MKSMTHVSAMPLRLVREVHFSCHGWWVGLLLSCCLLHSVFVISVSADVPQLLNYQGRVVVDNVNFDGLAGFKFALVNGDASMSYWSNDGTSVAGAEPAAAVSLTVTKGLYSVLLGDVALTNMTAVPASVFANADVNLRVWFDDGVNGSLLLSPDQRIAAVGYAMVAASAAEAQSVAAGAITSAMLAPGTVAGPANIAGTTQAAEANTSYVATNAGLTTINLTNTAANVGDVVRITGTGAGGWTVQAFDPDSSQWTPRDSDRPWRSVASSADGSKLVAVGGFPASEIYTSTDFGANWTERETARNWTSVASSSDGNKLVAVVGDGQLYTSTDAGVNWTARETARSWFSVASSADGSKLVAAEFGGQIYTSTDSGVSWTARETARNWLSLASSADGSNLVAVVSNGQIYTSTDSGENWTARETNRDWSSVASSADGTKLVAVVGNSGGQIYTSTDSGVNWTAQETVRSWRSVTSSADGTHLAAVEEGGLIYTSVDSGVTWTSHESARLWFSIASSADASRLVAVAVGSRIYTSGASSSLASGAQGTGGLLQYLGNGEWRGVGETQIAAGAVGSAQLGEGAVGTTNIAAGAVGGEQIASGAITVENIARSADWTLPTSTVTIPNPSPQNADSFARSLAGVGSDRILIGEQYDDTVGSESGLAHLYDHAGNSLRIFQSPIAGTGQQFGCSVAAMAGGDSVVIGSCGANHPGALAQGAAYLFDLDGNLLQTFLSPESATGKFGTTVTTVGSDRVLVSGQADTASVSLFDLQGNLVQTFADPVQSSGDNFGVTLNAVGSDKVLISDSTHDDGSFSAGEVYLFDLQANLLATFRAPEQQNASLFGYSTAVIGDTVLIGAPDYDASVVNSGIACLYDLSGNLIRTFESPNPTSGYGFGVAVAYAGLNKVMISEPGNGTAGAVAGVVHLFDLDGTFLKTLQRPEPAGGNLFGFTMGPLGEGRVAVGSRLDDLGAIDAGAAYVISSGTYVPNLTAESVRTGGVTSTMLADDALLLEKVVAPPSLPVVAWGRNDQGQIPTPVALTEVNRLAAGGKHNLALLQNGTVVAWGDGRDGQATVPGGLTGVTAIGAGVAHSLAVRADGTVAAWGSNAGGQTTVPVEATSVVAVGGGANHSVALKSDGTVIAWGDNSFGQTDVPGGLSGVIGIAVGQDHALALKDDGTVVAWGQNDTQQTDVPGGLTNVIAIAAGSFHSLALKADGTVVAWGWDVGGQITVPVGLGQVAAISAGYAHSVALKEDGTVVAWGDNTYAQLDVVEGLVNVVAISAGDHHTLALRANLVPAQVARLDENNVFRGRVGIGRVAATNALEVEGQASKTTAGNWAANSDRRIKTDVHPVTGALDMIDRLNPVTFHYTPEYLAEHGIIDDVPYYNVIAQEFREVFPDAVRGSGDRLPDGSEILQVDTYPATITTIAAVKELNEKLKAKDNEIEKLKARLEALERLLSLPQKATSK